MSHSQEITVTVPSETIFKESMPYLASKVGMNKGIEKHGGETDVILDLSPILGPFLLKQEERANILAFLEVFLNGIFQFNGEGEFVVGMLPDPRIYEILSKLFSYLNLPQNLSDLLVLEVSDENDEYSAELDNEYQYEEDPAIAQDRQFEAFQKFLAKQDEDKELEL